MKISVITVCFNSERTIANTIESVLNQTTPPFEYIIIDGGSTDSTLNIIDKYSKDFLEKNIKYKWISEPDKGIYDAINKGIRNCNGEIVGIINSDDWYENDAINHANIAFSSTDKIDIAYGFVRQFEDEIELKVYRNSHRFLNKAMIAHPACFVRKQIYEDYGYYNTKYKSSADYDLFIKFHKNKLTFKEIDYIIANFRRGGMSSTIESRFETNEIQYLYGFISKKKYLTTKINIIKSKIFRSHIRLLKGK